MSFTVVFSQNKSKCSNEVSVCCLNRVHVIFHSKDSVLVVSSPAAFTFLVCSMHVYVQVSYQRPQFFGCISTYTPLHTLIFIDFFPSCISIFAMLIMASHYAFEFSLLPRKVGRLQIISPNVFQLFKRIFEFIFAFVVACAVRSLK